MKRLQNGSRGLAIDATPTLIRPRTSFREEPTLKTTNTDGGRTSAKQSKTATEKSTRGKLKLQATVPSLQTILYRQSALTTMAILTYDQYFDHVLAQLSDGNVRTVSEICEAVATRTGLTEEERAVAVGTGEAKYRNRVRWSLVHLYKAGMVAREGRGRYKITDRGAEALASGERVDRNYLLRFPEYREYVEADKT